MLFCLAVQLQWPVIGVTTKDPDSGPVPQMWGDINNDQYWYVIIRSIDCLAWHKGQNKNLQWDLNYSVGNTFGCHVSGTGELHLHHNGRDVGVAWEGLPTDQPLWGFVVLPGYKVEANYVIAQSEAVCVSLHVQLATEVEGVHLHDMYTAPYIPLGHHSFHVMTVSSPIQQCAWSLLIIRTGCTLRLRFHFRELHPLLGACML